MASLPEGSQHRPSNRVPAPQPTPFPVGVQFVPVPAPMLGTLLARFDDERVLKVVLRAIWHVHQKKGAPRPVTVREIAADSVMSEALGLRGEQLTEAVAAALVA